MPGKCSTVSSHTHTHTQGLQVVQVSLNPLPINMLPQSAITNPHLSPLPGLNVQHPHVIPGRTTIPSTSHQELWAGPTIPQTCCCMVTSPHRAGLTLTTIQFTPVLHKTKSNLEASWGATVTTSETRSKSGMAQRP